MSYYTSSSTSTTRPSRSHSRSARSAANPSAPKAPPPSAADGAREDEWVLDDEAVFLQLDSKLLEEGMQQLGMDDEGGEPTFVDLLEEMVAGGERDPAADACAQGAASSASHRFASTQRPLSPRTSPTPLKHSTSFCSVYDRQHLPVYAFTHQTYDDSPFASREHSPIFDIDSMSSSRSSLNLYDESDWTSEASTTPQASVRFAASRAPAASAATRKLRTAADLKSEPQSRRL